MNKEELLRILSAYLPYSVTVTDISNDQEFILDPENLPGVLNDAEHLDIMKLHLYDLSYLTKEELRSAGFDDHIDYLTHEREGWIEKYGFDNYIKKLPYGHFQYLVSQHYNVFNLPESEFINKATLK